MARLNDEENTENDGVFCDKNHRNTVTAKIDYLPANELGLKEDVLQSANHIEILDLCEHTDWFINIKADLNIRFTSEETVKQAVNNQPRVWYLFLKFISNSLHYADLHIGKQDNKIETLRSSNKELSSGINPLTDEKKTRYRNEILRLRKEIYIISEERDRLRSTKHLHEVDSDDEFLNHNSTHKLNDKPLTTSGCQTTTSTNVITHQINSSAAKYGFHKPPDKIDAFDGNFRESSPTPAPLSDIPITLTPSPTQYSRPAPPRITPYNGTSGNLRAFCSQLTNQIQDSEICFPTELSKVRFAYQCLGLGALLKMRSSFPLKQRCQDPALLDKASHAAETLYQGSMSFHEFITFFEDNMADSNYSDLENSQWKAMLERRLSPELRRALLAHITSPTNIMPISSRPNPAPRSEIQSRVPAPIPVAFQPELTVSQGGTAMDLDAISRCKDVNSHLTASAKDARRKLGRCIRCNKSGHIANIRTETLITLVDSGTSGFAFISQGSCDRLKLTSNLLNSPIALGGFEGKSGTQISKSVSFRIAIGSHNERISAFVVPNLKYDLVLGLPWLEKHSPYTNWQERTITFGENCLKSACCNFETTIPYNKHQTSHRNFTP
ncbi:hypothetical protein EPUL_004290 [Erysiphe pulchra]|uniref:Uncharacterized protein n=1 Tax=Erysiphe pulchra TaxID=225359 RepID=A0A2S4PPP8_9PEZI|nr:hypothetical protein EPUL_004290 [Erysiphe pulchra]